MYPCTKCGCCCEKIGEVIPVLKGYGDENLLFPFNVSESGVCEKYSNGACEVYEDRPIVCNIDKLAEYLKLDKGGFYQKNILACNELITRNGLSDEFLIKNNS